MTVPLEMKAWLQTLNLQQGIPAPLQPRLSEVLSLTIVSSGEALLESDIVQCSYVELYAPILLWYNGACGMACATYNLLA